MLLGAVLPSYAYGANDAADLNYRVGITVTDSSGSRNHHLKSEKKYLLSLAFPILVPEGHRYMAFRESCSLILMYWKIPV